MAKKVYILDWRGGSISAACNAAKFGEAEDFCVFNDVKFLGGKQLEVSLTLPDKRIAIAEHILAPFV